MPIGRRCGQNRKLFAVGPYPADQLWQPAVVLLVTCLLFGLSAGRWGSILRSLAIGLAALLAALAIIPLGTQAQMVMALGVGVLVAMAT